MGLLNRCNTMGVVAFLWRTPFGTATQYWVKLPPSPSRFHVAMHVLKSYSVGVAMRSNSTRASEGCTGRGWAHLIEASAGARMYSCEHVSCTDLRGYTGFRGREK